MSDHIGKQVGDLRSDHEALEGRVDTLEDKVQDGLSAAAAVPAPAQVGISGLV